MGREECLDGWKTTVWWRRKSADIVSTFYQQTKSNIKYESEPCHRMQTYSGVLNLVIPTLLPKKLPAKNYLQKSTNDDSRRSNATVADAMINFNPVWNYNFTSRYRLAPVFCIQAMDFYSQQCGAFQHKNKNTIWWSAAQTVYKVSCNGCLDAKCNRAAEFHLFHKLGRHYAVLPNTSWCTEVRWPSFSWLIYYALLQNAIVTKWRWYRRPSCGTFQGNRTQVSFVVWTNGGGSWVMIVVLLNGLFSEQEFMCTAQI